MAIFDFLKGAKDPDIREVSIFPLNTVLFPGAILPLKVFEQRYVEMTKTCLKDDVPFGVCLIKEGAEVGNPALPEEVGCLASILEWDMQQLGIFHLKTLGSRRFRIVDREVAESGLITARVELIPDEADSSVPDEDRACVAVLKLIVERLGEEHFQPPFRFDDTAWVGYRLAEVLPIKLAAKQKLLELTDSRIRLQVLHKFLAQQGLAT